MSTETPDTAAAAAAESTGTTPNEQFVHRLRRALIDALRQDLAQEPDRWVIFDFPSQLNCGDSAIWLGEQAAARAIGARVDRTVDRRNADAATVRDDQLIVLHGGGNFGGLYRSHERLRLSVLNRFRGRRVVQLPQSIEWAGAESLEATKRAVGEHGDVLLYVRDRRSLERARAELDCEARLVPDAAFALGPLDRPRTSRTGLVVQRRTDKEAAIAGPLDHEAFDWLEAPRLSRRATALRAAELAFDTSRRLGGRDIRVDTMLAAALAQLNLRFAQARLADGSRTVTDRLHGHVVSTLMSVEHCVVDDAHGKVRALWDTWTNGSPCATFRPDWSSAAEWMSDGTSDA